MGNECKRCGIKLPKHQAENEVCLLCEPPKESHGSRGFSVFSTIAIIVLAIVGFSLQTCSYKRIAELRQIGRIPQTKVVATVPGEVNLTGRARVADLNGETLQAPDSETECLYYRYTKEREERDSDGDKKWVTIDSRTEFTPFDLDDTSGKIRIEPDDGVHFTVPESYQRRSGDLRYTEHRLEPGERVFVFGFLEKGEGKRASAVRFRAKGDYHPIISEKSELGERHSRATGSIWLCWFGLGALAVAATFLFSALGFHRILIFFGLLSVIISGSLLFQGLQMMASDISKSQQRVNRQETVVRELIQKELQTVGTTWNGDWGTLGDLSSYQELPAKNRTRLRRVRIDLASATRRSNAQSETFPYNLVRPFVSVPKPPEIPLTSRDEDFLRKLDSTFKTAKISRLGSAIGVIVAFIIGLITLLIGFRKVRNKRIIENLPTTSSAGVTYGLTELHGLVELPSATPPLSGPLSNESCISYRYLIQEKRGSGKNAKVVTIHDERKQMRFLCRDREGVTHINPTDATIETWRKTTERKGRKTFTETRLQVGDPLYVMGYAQLDPQTNDRLYLARPEPTESKWSGAPFLLSAFQESHLLKKGGFQAALILSLTFSAALFAGLMFFGSIGSFNPASYLLASLIGPFLMAAIAVAIHYNDLVFLRERVRQAWSNIEVALQKRSNLIPALQEIAQGSLDFEREVQSSLAELRSIQAKGNLSAKNLSQELHTTHQAVNQVIALAENYPELSAGKNMSALARQLAACENEIAFISAGYNNAVETYNTRIASFPDLLLAKPLRFLPQSLLTNPPTQIEIPPAVSEGH